MSAKLVIVIGTAARGGIRSVIDVYERAGFYASCKMLFIASHTETRLSRRMLVALTSMVRVGCLLAQNKVALLHLHVSMRGSFWRKGLFLLMAKIFRVPAVLHIHGSEFSEFVEGGSQVRGKVIRLILGWASRIVVLSQFWADYVRTLTDTPIVVIGNFVLDSNGGTTVKDRDSRSVLFLGAFGERKGIYDLIPVFKEVSAACPEARLFCGGNGEIQEVQACVEASKLDDVVDVPGWVSGDEKFALLRKCSVFVLPSYNEGMPMAIIEAMSFSMAIISTRVGGISDLVEPGVNGYLIEPGDRTGLRTALLAILSSSTEQISAMGHASRLTYESRFSPKISLGRMRTVYAELGVTL